MTVEDIRVRAVEHPRCASCQHLWHIVDKDRVRGCRQCEQEDAR